MCACVRVCDRACIEGGREGRREGEREGGREREREGGRVRREEAGNQLNVDKLNETSFKNYLPQSNHGNNGVPHAVNDTGKLTFLGSTLDKIQKAGEQNKNHEDDER